MVVIVALIALVAGVRWLVAWEPAVDWAQPPIVGAPSANPAKRSDATPHATSTVQSAPTAAPVEASPPFGVVESPAVGVHAFPPLGTRPLLSGIIVPEDFELPPGYVRHLQVTDSGERLPAILMFHPHDTPRDWRGEPIPVTADRIVPAEYAPEGMPIQVLDVSQSQSPPSGLNRFLQR